MAVGSTDIDAGQILVKVYTPTGVNIGGLNMEVVGTATNLVDFKLDQYQILDSVYDEATNSLRVVII